MIVRCLFLRRGGKKIHFYVRHGGVERDKVRGSWVPFLFRFCQSRTGARRPFLTEAFSVSADKACSNQAVSTINCRAHRVILWCADNS